MTRGKEGKSLYSAAWWLILVVNLTYLIEGTSVVELSPSEWPVGMSVGHFPDG